MNVQLIIDERRRYYRRKANAIVCVAVVVAIVIGLVASCCHASPADASELRVIYKVADEYRLTTPQTRLLVAIRMHERGGTGLEFGVGQDYPNHPARRFKDWRSLRVQARWAAGTIKKRYTGDLYAFSARWGRDREAWTRSVRAILQARVSATQMRPEREDRGESLFR